MTAAEAGRTLWRVRCVGRYLDRERPVADFTAPAALLLESAAAAAQAALAECERRGWAGRDVETLRRALATGRAPDPRSN